MQAVGPFLEAFGTTVTAGSALMSAQAARKAANASVPPPPAAPTLSTVQPNSLQELDRIKMRKGVAATIFGGAQPGALGALTAGKALLG